SRTTWGSTAPLLAFSIKARISSDITTILSTFISVPDILLSNLDTVSRASPANCDSTGDSCKAVCNAERKGDTGRVAVRAGDNGRAVDPNKRDPIAIRAGDSDLVPAVAIRDRAVPHGGQP